MSDNETQAGGKARRRHEALTEWKRRKPRNWAILGFLVVLAVLFYVLTVVRIGGA